MADEMVNIKQIASKHGISSDEVFDVLLSQGAKINQKLLYQRRGETFAPGWLLDEMYRVESEFENLVLDEEYVKAKRKPYTPKLPVVYFLYNGDDLVYIGQSCDVDSRVAHHVKDKEFNGISLFPISRNDLLDVEYANIRRYKPKYNRMGVSDGAYHFKYLLKKCQLLEMSGSE